MVLLCAGQSWAGWAGKNNGLTQGQARPCISDLCWSSWWWLGVCTVQCGVNQNLTRIQPGQSRTEQDRQAGLVESWQAGTNRTTGYLSLTQRPPCE